MSLFRAITYHHVGVEELDSAYEITALDKSEPLSKCYRVMVLDSEPGHQSFNTFNIQFQDGDPAAVGHNGLTDEVLLAILIDRAKCMANSLADFRHPEHGDYESLLVQAMSRSRQVVLEWNDARKKQDEARDTGAT